MNRTGRVLLVEDDPTLAMFFVRALARAGYAVEAHECAEDGLRAVLGGSYDIVLLDWHLTGRMDGLELLVEMRAAGNAARVLMFSGSGDLARAEALANGADAFLAKPFGLAELLEAVGALLASSQGAAAWPAA